MIMDFHSGFAKSRSLATSGMVNGRRSIFSVSLDALTLSTPSVGFSITQPSRLAAVKNMRSAFTSWFTVAGCTSRERAAR